MKVAVIGSRELQVANLGEYLPENTTEIISGGARGVDTSAREYAQHHGLKLTEYLPEYRKYGKYKFICMVRINYSNTNWKLQRNYSRK